MTEAQEWKGRVGDVWAEEWRRTDRALGPVGQALVGGAKAELAGGQAPWILDLGCGAGTTSLQLAEQVADARVIGIDLSESLIAVARERGHGDERVQFEIADASSWRPSTDARFDLVVSRHGVMFFADPVAAFAHVRHLMAPGGRLLFSCFRARAENDWVAMLDPLIARYAPESLAAPPPPVGPFAFADPIRVAQILIDAGFEPPRIAPLDFDFVAGAGTDPVADAVSYFERIGPFARLLSQLGDEQRREAVALLRQILSGRQTGDAVRLHAATWIASARTP